MKRSDLLAAIKSQTRQFKRAKEGYKILGPLKQLPGTWKSEGMGWNIIAVPFVDGPFNYRVLMNQYDETLKFTNIDEFVPNRGIPSNEFPPDPGLPDGQQSDQFVTTLDYEQSIKQVAAADFPISGLAGGINKDIHHEPGLFLNMLNKKTDNIDIARLATIPHGDSVLALGRSEQIEGPPVIPVANALPFRVPHDLQNPYLEPYKVFVDTPFKGNIRDTGFPGFNPLDANALLRLANSNVNIKKTTILT